MTGTVTIGSAAPAGGLTIQLSSANTAYATVPATVTIPAGATSATFTITPMTQTADKSVVITATFNGVSKTVTVTAKK